jgi:hypothetical protein
MLAVRSDADHYVRPLVFYTSQRVSDFFDLSLKQSMADIAVRLEAYCISGVQGIFHQVNNYCFLT